MTELERARAHLRASQNDLAKIRGAGMPPWIIGFAEGNVLAALSWVWEEQEKVNGDSAWHNSRWRVIRLESRA